ncbi:MAG TPA: hypothetical protein VM434_18620 [Beijerinckiaceae bacterium]|nr:hypothetical protein [Beijerinckiaceae bacterium]
MSTEIDALDRALARAGEDVILRRVVGSGAAAVNIDVKVRASVRSPRSDELAAGIAQTESIVVMSPSGIAAAQWPGGEVQNVVGGVLDPSLPRKGDWLVIAGKPRRIEHVAPIRIGDEVVRFKMRVLG